jgi:hypothetical protein
VDIKKVGAGLRPAPRVRLKLSFGLTFQQF